MYYASVTSGYLTPILSNEVIDFIESNRNDISKQIRSIMLKCAEIPDINFANDISIDSRVEKLPKYKQYVAEAIKHNFKNYKNIHIEVEMITMVFIRAADNKDKALNCKVYISEPGYEPRPDEKKAITDQVKVIASNFHDDLYKYGKEVVSIQLFAYFIELYRPISIFFNINNNQYSLGRLNSFQEMCLNMDIKNYWEDTDYMYIDSYEEDDELDDDED